MKEILFKFETEEDYLDFLRNVIDPSIQKGDIDYDSQNNIAIVKNIKKKIT